MNPDLTSIEVRKEILKDIRSSENQARKLKAYECYRIFKDDFHDHVCAYLVEQFGKEAARQMPKISAVNIAKKVITEEASVYFNSPTRTFGNTEEDEIKILESVFADGKFNAKLKKTNEYFKLYKGQIFLQIVLRDKKLCPRVVLPYQVDVIPDAENPEKAFAFITSSFDKTCAIKSDGVNQIIADKNDAQALKERYTVWSNDLNFIMNGKGEIVSEGDLSNEVGVCPFVDISVDKDGEFYVLAGKTDTDFTIQYNGSLSDLQYICRLQGYAQAVFTGDPKSMPEVVRTGPNIVIKLATNPDNPVQPDFKFATPSPDIEGTIKALEMLLANYLTTRGIDSKVISNTLSSTTTYNSGIERLLAMLEEFEASADDFEIFLGAEQEIFSVIKSWLIKYSGTEFLDKKYWVKPATLDATLTTVFARPEAVRTESEQLDDMKKGYDLGIEDEVTACIKLKGMTEEQAEEYLTKIKGRRGKYSKNDFADGNSSNSGEPGKFPPKDKEAA